MEQSEENYSRRSFLSKTPIAGAAATAFTIIRPELVRGAGNEMLKAGLVGCGGRGTQAVADFLTGTENTQLVAMGDIFEDKLEASLRFTKSNPRLAKLQDRVKVDPDKRFVGFDAFQKVINSDVDIVMLATPPVLPPGPVLGATGWQDASARPTASASGT